MHNLHANAGYTRGKFTFTDKNKYKPDLTQDVVSMSILNSSVSIVPCVQCLQQTEETRDVPQTVYLYTVFNQGAFV